ncbi:tRNA (adenosine(37)-N6)-threonylcarbamoyltransferase complex ATPase subunit type 1 TsaE [Terrihabitans sp. B22-R8]|uniref:tRNA (adenosine(37)-N6)-threonylcarbamoyltransferase complex ATPase subunit type 1 TsaE n=1 Tax=Terrihabitans sp. B22-R8 TaxID=3425128 RepID=UPI00403CE93C
MSRPADPDQVLTLADEAATARFAAALAPLLAPGDVIALSGDLGSGKTTFARHIIRQLAGDPDLDVPSPTFSLIQTYETARGPILHADLYRIADAAELSEIGWDEAGPSAISLVEWPDRADPELTREALALTFSMDPQAPERARRVRIEAPGPWLGRIARGLEIAAFLDMAGWSGATRIHIQGDASSRRYEKLVVPERSAILMDAPRRPDGPPIRDGKPYSRIAHLAEDVRPFVALADGLRGAGFSAPKIHASDLDRGLLLTEDFGRETLLVGGEYAQERIAAATDLLAALHAIELPGEIPMEDGDAYQVPLYDRDALLIEVELLVDWYLPHAGISARDVDRERFVRLWRKAVEPLADAVPTWVLRDYHSPNLMWLPDRKELRRVGLLDFQDAVIGHPAYDLVSLLQDARIDVPETLEMSMLLRYVGARRAAPQVFDPAAFARAYATLGAQRATKILGIFVRLAVRDGKQNYLAHLPRLLHYLERNLAHPSLADLRAWYDETMGPLGNAAAK